MCRIRIGLPSCTCAVCHACRGTAAAAYTYTTAQMRPAWLTEDANQFGGTMGDQFASGLDGSDMDVFIPELFRVGMSRAEPRIVRACGVGAGAVR